MKVLDATEFADAVTTLADGVCRIAAACGDVALLGIPERGVPLAARVADRIEAAGNDRPPLGELDVTLHRDDLAEVAVRKPLRETRIPFDVTGRTIVLVDDVIFSARTARAALDAVMRFGRPARIALAVLIDRGHRELPIHPDVTGRTLEIDAGDRVHVRMREIDGADEVIVEKDE